MFVRCPVVSAIKDVFGRYLFFSTAGINMYSLCNLKSILTHRLAFLLSHAMATYYNNVEYYSQMAAGHSKVSRPITGFKILKTKGKLCISNRSTSPSGIIIPTLWEIQYVIAHSLCSNMNSRNPCDVSLCSYFIS